MPIRQNRNRSSYGEAPLEPWGPPAPPFLRSSFQWLAGLVGFCLFMLAVWGWSALFQNAMPANWLANCIRLVFLMALAVCRWKFRERLEPIKWIWAVALVLGFIYSPAISAPFVWATANERVVLTGQPPPPGRFRHGGCASSYYVDIKDPADGSVYAVSVSLPACGAHGIHFRFSALRGPLGVCILGLSKPENTGR
jgi:hypothetical protein